MLEFTKHAKARMNQRGISLEMIELTIEYGICVQDKVILKYRDINALLYKVSKEIKSKLLKIMDKGGLVVVSSDDYAVITVYNKFK